MTQTGLSQNLGVRATSMVVSAATLGALTLAALSATWATQSFNLFPNAPPVTIVEAPPPAPPPQPRPRALPRVQVDPMPSDIPDVIPTLPPAEDTTNYTGPITYDPGPAMITNPHWLQRPSGLDAYYPRRAAERGMEGQVVLDCLVDVTGALGCAIVSETPRNWGFGEAALRISRDYRMSPAMRDGRAVQGRYRMVAPFRLE